MADSQEIPDVYPLYMLDGAAEKNPFTLTWMLRFCDVLDADTLRDSLTELLQIGDWRKLAGRIKRKSDGHLEIHVASSFTTEHPAIGFSHLAFETPIKLNPLGIQIPEPTQDLSVHGHPRQLNGLCNQGSQQQGIQVYIDEQLPQLHLHVTNFTDETLVFITWNHVSLDAPGVADLLRNWSLVMAGHHEKVQTYLGARSDVLKELAPAATDTKNEAFEKRPLLLRGLNKVLFFGRLVWNSFLSGPSEMRLVCLPHQAVQQLEEEAQTQLDGADNKQGHFVGEGDIITAWVAQLVAKSLPYSRPVSIWNAVNCKFRLPTIMKQSHEGVYPQNMSIPLVFTNLNSQEASGSLGRIAGINRKTIMEQATEEEMLSYLRLRRRTYDSGGKYLPLFAEPNSAPVFINNITKLSMLDIVDFSPAVVATGSQQTTPTPHQAGKPIYHHYVPSAGAAPKYIRFPVFVIFGKDGQENYWMTISASARFWETMEQEVKRFR